MPERTIVTLSESDVTLLQGVLDRARRDSPRPGADTPEGGEEYLTPETYVVRVPDGGLPGINDLTPGAVECDVYRVSNSTLRAVPGLRRKVHNLGGALPGDSWVGAWRDKFGTWFAGAGSGAPLSGCDPPTGVAPAGTFHYQEDCDSGSGSGSGCGTLWVSCGNGCWQKVLLGDPVCPESGSGGGDTVLVPCCPSPVAATVYLTVTNSIAGLANGTYPLHWEGDPTHTYSFAWLYNAANPGHPFPAIRCVNSTPVVRLELSGSDYSNAVPGGTCDPFFFSGSQTMGGTFDWTVTE